MRRTFIVVSVSALLFAGAQALRAQPKGQRTTITGEVVDLWCYLEGGDRGPAKKDCATACAKAGNPIGVLDAKGNLYVAAGLKDHQPAKSGRLLSKTANFPLKTDLLGCLDSPSQKLLQILRAGYRIPRALSFSSRNLSPQYPYSELSFDTPRSPLTEK